MDCIEQVQCQRFTDKARISIDALAAAALMPVPPLSEDPAAHILGLAEHDDNLDLESIKARATIHAERANNEYVTEGSIAAAIRSANDVPALLAALAASDAARKAAGAKIAEALAVHPRGWPSGVPCTCTVCRILGGETS